MASNDLLRIPGYCRICGGLEDIRNIDLYVIGSEGLWVCLECELSLVEHVRGVILIAGKARKLGYQACNKELRTVSIENRKQFVEIMKRAKTLEMAENTNGNDIVLSLSDWREICSYFIL